MWKYGLSAVLLLCFVPLYAFAQWSEPTYEAVAMTAPLADDPPPITGTTYYVDCANGDNADAGGIGDPWLTIDYAGSQLTAGDGVLVRGGTCTEGNINLATTGTAGNYITFRAYPGEYVKVNATGFTWGFNTGWGTSGRDYVVIDGFEIFGAINQNICLCGTTSDHIWVINNRIHSSGLQLMTGEGTMTNQVISNNTFYNAPINAMNFTEDSNRNYFEFNTIYNTSRNSDDAGAFKTYRGWETMVRYNIVFNNSRDPFSCTACFGGGFTGCQEVAGLYVDFSFDDDQSSLGTFVYNNIVYGNGAGIHLWKAQRTRVFNNIVYNNGHVSAGNWSACTDSPRTFSPYVGFHGTGIANRGGVGDVNDVLIWNNTITTSARYGIYFENGENSIVRNNIMSENGINAFRAIGTIGTPAAAWLNYNSYNQDAGTLIHYLGTDYASLAAFVAVETALEGNGDEGDPLIADGRAGGNFTRGVLTGSPVNDAGITATYAWDFENTTRTGSWDIGAMEKAPVAALTGSGVQ